ncbi:MAG: hypothetical protein OHK93_007959 [Ramalina farinacea]|uniref:Uncharacterized protein n=1 Tax=Ramalina farinacea TaxID=258253 RepID=A0AA43QLI0_9LECA|nr:hypothetical protein [Ramalina farinacea]
MPVDSPGQDPASKIPKKSFPTQKPASSPQSPERGSIDRRFTTDLSLSQPVTQTPSLLTAMRIPPLASSLSLLFPLLRSTHSHPFNPPSSTTLNPRSNPNLTTPSIPVSSDPPIHPNYILDITPSTGEGKIGRTLFTLFASSLLAEVEGIIARPSGRGALTPLDSDPWEVRRRGVRLWLESVPYTNPSPLNLNHNTTTNSVQTSEKRDAAALTRRAGGGTVDYLDYGLVEYMITELRDRGNGGEWDYGAGELEVSVVEADGAVDVVARGGVERKIFAASGGGEGGDVT